MTVLGMQCVCTPTIFTNSWVNYSDRRDKVALDMHLRDGFGANSRGVRVEDDMVDTGNRGLSDEASHHKFYGYLGTPEPSQHINEFLAS